LPEVTKKRSGYEMDSSKAYRNDKKDVDTRMELREYEPTTPLPLSSSKFNRGVRQMFEEMEISVK
jgi:hypothetical protein